MTYIYETVIGTKKLVVEYCYSSVDNCIKVVEMTADGKFHRFNWMNEVGQKKLMSQLMKHYDGIMLGQQDPEPVSKYGCVYKNESMFGRV
tara:strand:+ start:139 stop:408 length:270 start_codon:yes stop_codon:yes gene_type:complete